MTNQKKENTILIRNADYVVTMNKKGEILRNASLLISGNKISEIGTKKVKAGRTIDASGMIVLPGFVNCHHHMFQCGLRGMPALQNQTIDKWINIVCNATKKMNDEIIYYSALANMAELLLYGCTTTADMMYIFPRKKKNFFEATIKAASDIGIRFHPYRGSMSLSKKNKSQFSNDVVQDSEAIAVESEDVIRKFHDKKPFSMLMIGLAPCTIFSSKPEDYKNAYELSKKYSVNLQTHLSESEYENAYSLRKFKKRPLNYLEDMGWSGKNVSFVHAIHINGNELTNLAKKHTNVVHCPISNARKPVGSTGIAPVWEMLEKKINVAIGTDGSAGNDSSNVLEELRWARTLQGVRSQSTYLKALTVLEMGTISGAKLLNWESGIGTIEVGRAADISIFDFNDKVEYAGALGDPIISLVASQAQRARYVLVNGKVIIENGIIKTVSVHNIIRQLTRRLKKISN